MLRINAVTPSRQAMVRLKASACRGSSNQPITMTVAASASKALMVSHRTSGCRRRLRKENS
ncbi:hypothetical protein LP415_13410 [Polaromonas sp. P1(28)-8]|nr:hypothetical protein LP415_13410 [Polaromonas sp. P1(28)-8]